MGWWVVDGWNPIAATGSTVTSIVAVFQDAGNARILLYSLMVGSVVIVSTHVIVKLILLSVTLALC